MHTQARTHTDTHTHTRKHKISQSVFEVVKIVRMCFCRKAHRPHFHFTSSWTERCFHMLNKVCMLMCVSGIVMEAWHHQFREGKKHIEQWECMFCILAMCEVWECLLIEGVGNVEKPSLCQGRTFNMKHSSMIVKYKYISY